MMSNIQHKPLFVPFQKTDSRDFKTQGEQRLIRTVIASLTAFLLAVTLVSFTTNKYEEKLREVKAAAAICQAGNPSALPTATPGQ